METKTTSPATTGFITALVLMALGLITHFAKLDKVKGMGALQYLVLGTGIIWACWSYAKQLNGQVTFGNCFAHGFKVAAAVTALMAIYTFVSLKFIMPEILELSKQEAVKGMQQEGMTASEIEQNIAVGKKYAVAFGVAATSLMLLIAGCIFALIGAAIAKKAPNYNPIQE